MTKPDGMVYVLAELFDVDSFVKLISQIFLARFCGTMRNKNSFSKVHKERFDILVFSLAENDLYEYSMFETFVLIE